MRRIEVYLPTDLVDRYETLASGAGASVEEFVAKLLSFCTLDARDEIIKWMPPRQPPPDDRFVLVFVKAHVGGASDAVFPAMYDPEKREWRGYAGQVLLYGVNAWAFLPDGKDLLGE